MADHKPRILSTRPIEAALLEQAAARGVIIDTLSFIVTDPIAGTALQNHIRQLGRQPLIVVFTSMNAVEAVAGLLADKTSDPASPGHILTNDRLPWRIYSIGYATQQLVRQYWGEDCIAGTAASAAALANTIIAGQAAGRPGPAGEASPEVTFFCGDQRREELPEKLREQAIQVNEIVVYRTIQTPHKVEPVYDGIAFFSPSAVHSFFAKNGVSSGTLLFAIGQTTADTIRDYAPNNYTIQSGSPEKRALIRQVIDYYNNKI